MFHAVVDVYQRHSINDAGMTSGTPSLPRVLLMIRMSRRLHLAFSLDMDEQRVSNST